MIGNEQIEILSASKAAKITGLSVHTILHGMDVWTATHGRLGLRFVRPRGTRRLVRRSALLDWFSAQERATAYGA